MVLKNLFQRSIKKYSRTIKPKVMKTKTIITMTILFFTVTVVFAKSPKSDLQQTIKSHIIYPANIIKKQIEGNAFVEFTIKENRIIEVLNSNSLSGDLMVYVVDELSLISLTVYPGLYGQKFLMRFDFKLE